tara:strand:+ start:3425 stop:4261 length:837 start_codon:yes stop_codon:yes gene_type:complete
MNKLKKILIDLNFNFEIYEQISDSETSQTFIGKFNNSRSIFKLPKNNNLELIINEYLKNQIIDEIIKKNITPKFLFIENKTGLIIYEYFKKDSSKKSLSNITKLGKQLKKLHQIKIHEDTKNFEEQFNLYLSVQNLELDDKYFIDSVDLFNDLKNYKDDYVLSHNDLNLSNVMFNKNDIFFIDFEYLSINSKYCDLSKLIDSLKLNEIETNELLKSYGIKNISRDVHLKIKKWALMNTYIELIWSKFISKSNNSCFSTGYFNNLIKNIKQQRQQIKLI